MTRYTGTVNIDLTERAARLEDLANALKDGVGSILPKSIVNEDELVTITMEVCLACVILMISILKDPSPDNDIIIAETDDEIRNTILNLVDFILEHGNTRYVRKM